MIISGQAKVAGVMGWPVEHSRSPRLHGYWLDHYGIDGAYVPLPVHPDNLGDALRALPALGFAGVNLTIPHKQTAVHWLDRVDRFAHRIGAVNTVIVDSRGRLEGTNTDAFGFVENLRAGLDGWTADGATAALLGAGGAARAVVVALIDEGAAEIRIVNRTRARAEELAALGGRRCRVYDWEDVDVAIDGAALLINTTSLGMAGQPPLDLDLSGLGRGAVVTDIVYTPLQTALLARASAEGFRTVDGLGMLIHQARPGFEAWFGRRPAVTDTLRAFLLSDLSD